MNTSSLTGLLRQKPDRDPFVKNKSGSMLTWVAVSLIPLVVSVGGATDIARGFVLRSQLSTALDAAALAGGRAFNLPTRDADVQAYFDANLPQGLMGAEIGELIIEPIRIQGEPERLRVSASASLPTLFMKLVGIDEFEVATSSEVTRENLGLQLTMVLDVTGSMNSSGKIGALRRASRDLVDILFGVETLSSKLSIAIVPYAQAVNVGDLGDDFIDWSYLPEDLRTHTDWRRRWGGCVQARSTPGILSTDKTVLEADAYDSNLAPVEVGGKWKPYIYPHWDTGRNPPGWEQNRYRQLPFGPDMDPSNPGFKAPANIPYVDDDDAYRDGKGTDGDPLSLPNGTSSGPNKDCPSRVLPFTGTRSTLENYIDTQLTTKRYTIGNQGLIWGWRMLDPDPPFPNAVPYNDPETIKALIMMTDGTNEIGSGAYTAYGRLSERRLGTTSRNTAVREFDKRMEKICHAMKAGGKNGRDRIEVYTVILGTVATSTNSNSTRLRGIYRDCASRPANAFLAPSNAELQSAFRTIGNDLANLHLSR
ncbi:pilus assembly protein TadG-related protein [Iodidimonas muriae]|nr:pilus assembly protein TadG-related protein [Iodidimonas muriae]